jgi:hypothetical protein
MGIIEKADQEVSATAPKVVEAISNIKFLIITVPVLCVVIAIVTQTITTERNIGMILFKLGTIATPASPDPVPLAGENQIRARLRQHSDDMRDGDYPKSLLIAVKIENDVVTITGTDKGDLNTRKYLLDLAQQEIDFQNGRFKKMQRVQRRRMKSQEQTLEDFTKQRTVLQRRLETAEDPVAMLALQQGIDNASIRIAGIRKELDTHDLLNASDLFVDTTQIIRRPVIIASSDWYRPLIFGAIGLAIGLFLTLVIVIVVILRAFSPKKHKNKDTDTDTDTDKDNGKDSNTGLAPASSDSGDADEKEPS